MGQTRLVDYGGIAKILWPSAGDVAVQKNNGRIYVSF
jgi:hypothetical protein